LGDPLTPGWEQEPSTYKPRDLVSERARAHGRRLPVRECVRIAIEQVAAIKAEGFKGVVLSTLGWEHKLPDIVEGI
jgi:hypothetical protein